MDSIAGQPSPAAHPRGLASRFSAIRKAVSSRDLHGAASPRSSSSSGYEASSRPSAQEPRHGRRPSVDYIPYTGPIADPPPSSQLPVLPQPNVGPNLSTTVEPFFGRTKPISSRARSGSASAPFIGPSDPRAVQPLPLLGWSNALTGMGTGGDDHRFGRSAKDKAPHVSARDTGRAGDFEVPRTMPSQFANHTSPSSGIAFPTSTGTGRPSLGEGLPTAYSHFNYAYKPTETQPYMPASMRSDMAPPRVEKSLIAGREFAPAGFTYRPTAPPRTPVNTSQLYKPRSRDSNDQQTPGRGSIRTVGSAGTMGGDSSGSAMSTSTSMTSLQASSAHHKQLSSSSRASSPRSPRELRSAASVPNLRRVTPKQSGSGAATPLMPSLSQERLPATEKSLPAIPPVDTKADALHVRGASRQPALSPISASMQGSTILSQIDSDSSASAQRRYFLLQQLHLEELAAHSPDTTGYLVPDNSCEKVFVPKPRLRHNSTDSKGSRESQNKTLPVFERNRPVPPLVIVGRAGTDYNAVPSNGVNQTAFSHSHAKTPSVPPHVPHRDGSARTSHALRSSVLGNQYVYDAEADAEMRRLRAQAPAGEGAETDMRPFFHHRMPPDPPQSAPRAGARDSITRPKTPKGGWGVLAHRQRTSSGNLLASEAAPAGARNSALMGRAVSQDRVPVMRPFSPGDDELDVQTVLEQGMALDREREAWRRQHQRSIGASSAPSWARRDRSMERGRSNSGRLGSRDMWGTGRADIEKAMRARDDGHLDPRGGEIAPRQPAVGFEETHASTTRGHARQLSAYQQGQAQRRLRQARSSPQLGASYGRFETPSPAMPSSANCVPAWLVSRPGLKDGWHSGRSQSKERVSVPNKVREVRKKFSGRNLCGSKKFRSRGSPSPPSSPTHAARDAVRIAAHRRMRTSTSFDITVVGRGRGTQDTLQLPGDERLRRNSWRASNLHDPPSSDGHGSAGRKQAEPVGAVLMHEEPFVIARDTLAPRSAQHADFQFPPRAAESGTLQERRSGAETHSGNFVGIALPSPPSSADQGYKRGIAGRQPTSPTYHRPSNSADLRAALRAKELSAAGETGRPSPSSGGRFSHNVTSSGSIAASSRPSLDSNRTGTVTPPKRKSSLTHMRKLSKGKSSEVSSEDASPSNNFLAGIFRKPASSSNLVFTGGPSQGSPLRADFPRNPASLPVPPRRRPSLFSEGKGHTHALSDPDAPQLPPLSLDNLQNTMLQGSEPFQTPTLPANAPTSPLDYGSHVHTTAFRTPLNDLDTPASTAGSYFASGVSHELEAQGVQGAHAAEASTGSAYEPMSPGPLTDMPTPPTPLETARADSDLDDASVIDPGNATSPRIDTHVGLTSPGAELLASPLEGDDADSPLADHDKFRTSSSRSGRSGMTPSPNADGAAGLLRSDTGQSKYRGHSAASSESNFTLTSIAPKELWNADQEEGEFDNLFFRRGESAGDRRSPTAASEAMRRRRSIGRSDGSGNGVSGSSDEAAKRAATPPRTSHAWSHRDDEIPALPTSPQKFMADIHPPTPVMKSNAAIEAPPASSVPAAGTRVTPPWHRDDEVDAPLAASDIRHAKATQSSWPDAPTVTPSKDKQQARTWRVGRVPPPTYAEPSPPARRSQSFKADTLDAYSAAAAAPQTLAGPSKVLHILPFAPHDRVASSESEGEQIAFDGYRAERQRSESENTAMGRAGRAAFVPAPSSSGTASPPESNSLRTSMSSYAPSTDTHGTYRHPHDAKSSQPDAETHRGGRRESHGTIMSGYSLGSADEEALSRVIHGEWPEPADHGSNTRRWM